MCCSRGSGQQANFIIAFVVKRAHRFSESAPQKSTSGIAQLRKSSEQTQSQGSDLMNLDDFINGENMGTPAGMSLAPSPETSSKMTDDRAAHHSTASAIPIKSRKEQPAQHMIPQSVPAALHHSRMQPEFGYLPRHLRKTSIDETSKRVSSFLISSACLIWCNLV